MAQEQFPESFVFSQNESYHRIDGYPSLSAAEARKEIKALLDNKRFMVNVSPIVKADLQEQFGSLNSLDVAAVCNGMIWVNCYVESNEANTYRIEHGKPVCFDTVTGRCVTGINPNWDKSEYKIIGTAWKSFSGPGYGKIPVRLTDAQDGGGVSSGILFTLTSHLYPGVASVTVTHYWGRYPADENKEVAGEQVYVYDTQNLFLSSFTGSSGIAIWDDKEEKYRVVECESAAGWIEFTLQGSLSSGNGYAVVNGWGGSQQDIQQPISPLLVYDDFGLFKSANVGDTGIAFYNRRTDRYYVAECTSRAGWVIATVEGSSGIDLESVTVEDYGGTQQDIRNPGSVDLIDPLDLLSEVDFDDEETYYVRVFAIYNREDNNYVIVAIGGDAKQRVAIRVTLSEDWVAGPIQATITGTDPPVEIEVHDEQELFRRALDGADALAVWNYKESRWELAESDSKAGFIHFELLEDMAAPNIATSAELKDGSNAGAWGTQQDTQDPGAYLNHVRDATGLFQNAIQGADGVAALDKSGDEYIVIQCDQVATLVRASLSVKLESSDEFAQVSELAPMSVKPFGKAPVITQAKNLLQLMGCIDDIAILAINGSATDYMLLNIIHKTTEVVVDNNVDEENMELEHKKYPTAIIHNVDCQTPPPDFIPYHTGTDCAEEE
jgi:hypothetical protein